MESNQSTKQFLTVDEGMRPRANSDPVAGAKVKGLFHLPEIKVEDCTGEDRVEVKRIISDDDNDDDDECGFFDVRIPPRRRAHTCPDDLFRRQRSRPPTPPPATFRKGKHQSGSRSPTFKPVLKESVSFTHHRLCKLTEESREGHLQSLSRAGDLETVHSASCSSATQPQPSENIPYDCEVSAVIAGSSRSAVLERNVSDSDSSELQERSPSPDREDISDATLATVTADCRSVGEECVRHARVSKSSMLTKV